MANLHRETKEIAARVFARYGVAKGDLLGLGDWLDINNVRGPHENIAAKSKRARQSGAAYLVK
tara:strand:+ start:373 stop:561 length:189 start_codon:yes stop_codon:yes gene_type:complete